MQADTYITTCSEYPDSASPDTSCNLYLNVLNANEICYFPLSLIYCLAQISNLTFHTFIHCS